MKRFPLVVLLALAISHPVADSGRAADSSARNGVLVELFTSQGCSSCPSADILLNGIDSFDASATPIPLAFHVDYWDRLGWIDPFGSKRWTDRQRAYARAFDSETIYTPQAVVGGRAEFVGSSRPKMEAALAEHARPSGRFDLSARVADGRVVVSGSLSPTGGSGERTIFVALAESGLVVSVKAGENAGRTLTGNHVVRELREAGEVRMGAGAAAKRFAVEFELASSWRTDRLEVVAFAQNPDTLAVDCAARVEAAE